MLAIAMILSIQKEEMLDNFLQERSYNMKTFLGKVSSQNERDSNYVTVVVVII